MLTELRVRDLAVIADVTLKLGPGLNVLTGETGAGKSMLVDALSLLLGERASADIVRPGAPRAIVEAAFDVASAPPASSGPPARSAPPASPAPPAIVAAAQELGLELDDGQLIDRRDINAEGRNRAWDNGSPAPVAALGRLDRPTGRLVLGSTARVRVEVGSWNIYERVARFFARAVRMDFWI